MMQQEKRAIEMEMNSPFLLGVGARKGMWYCSFIHVVASHSVWWPLSSTNTVSVLVSFLGS